MVTRWDCDLDDMGNNTMTASPDGCYVEYRDYEHFEQANRVKVAYLWREINSLRKLLGWPPHPEAEYERSMRYEQLESWARLVCEYLEHRPKDEMNGAPLLLSLYRELPFAP